MDSMTLYRGMDIGTAKPTRRRAPARAAPPDRRARPVGVGQRRLVAGAGGRVLPRTSRRAASGSLFVGGTPLYLKALLYGLFDGPPADAALRRRLEAEAEQHGQPRPARPAGRGRSRDRGRGCTPTTCAASSGPWKSGELTGRPISDWQTQWEPAPARLTPGRLADAVLWLDLPRDELYDRIDARVEAMIADGLVEEVRRLRALPRPLSREAAPGARLQGGAATTSTASATLDETVARDPDAQPQLRQAAAHLVPPPARLPAGRRGIDIGALAVDNEWSVRPLSPRVPRIGCALTVRRSDAVRRRPQATPGRSRG